MIDHLDLNPELLESEPLVPEVSPDFPAILNVRGLYSTTEFVLRLSPRIHQLIDAVPSGVYSTDDLDAEIIQAFSTYLHETVHWWQHIGSTSGLILSLAYPGQAHQNSKHLAAVIERFGPKKSLIEWSEKAALAGRSDVELGPANSAVNNAIDVEFYKAITLEPPRLRKLLDSAYFETMGHCYWMAYGHAVSLLSSTVDREQKHPPDGRRWDDEFRRVIDAGIEGFTRGGPVRIAPFGLRALFEGQARFQQMQYLTFGIANPPTCDELRKAGFFSGVYGEAFEGFLKVTLAQWPRTIDDPLVALFLLIVDLAINPTVGFPLDIASFENFIIDVDPGIRFLRLCQAAVKHPALLSTITEYSRREYLEAADVLTKACEYDHPAIALQTVAGWATQSEGVAKILAEKETFRYEPENLVVRVLFSHFVSFCIDKLEHPEFFCWPGAWMAGLRVCDKSQELFLKYLSLYTDRADNDRIFPREIPGKDPAAISQTLNIFYGNIVIYDLTRQWILEDGPFVYDFDWLSQTNSKTSMTEWAKGVFEKIYKVSPDAFEILAP